MTKYVDNNEKENDPNNFSTNMSYSFERALNQDVLLKMAFENEEELLKLRREAHFLQFLNIILFGIDFVLIFLPFKTNTKTSLETNFQTRPRHVLK